LVLKMSLPPDDPYMQEIRAMVRALEATAKALEDLRESQRAQRECLQDQARLIDEMIEIIKTSGAQNDPGP
jgi:uncharacterized protein Yka (UPF0111/DUF47 family)